MRLASYRLGSEEPAARAAPVTTSDAGWVRFGDEVLLYAEDNEWDGVLEQARQQRLGLEERSDGVEKDHMHLVVQNGRRFQQEHPEVRVLFDKGRYLAVALDPEAAKQLDGGVCFGIKPLEENTVAFDIRARAAERMAPAAWIQDLVDTVSRSDFEASLAHLVSFRTRFSTSAQFGDAAAWARARLDDLGYATAVQQISIPVLGDDSQNVVAERLGTGSGTRDLVLVVAHLDSINIGGGPQANAPGADDNATGSAGVLEIARVLADLPSEHDLRLVLFGGEEEGLFGSQQYLDNLPAADRTRIRAVINMDMIGTLNTPTPSVLLEGAAVSQALIDELASAAAAYTALNVQTSLHPFNSDHVPFIEEGFSAVLTIEGTDSANDNVHTANDTLENIDYDLALEILRMNVATTAKALGTT